MDGSSGCDESGGMISGSSCGPSTALMGFEGGIVGLVAGLERACKAGEFRLLIGLRGCMKGELSFRGLIEYRRGTLVSVSDVGPDDGLCDEMECRPAVAFLSASAESSSATAKETLRSVDGRFLALDGDLGISLLGTFSRGEVLDSDMLCLSAVGLLGCVGSASSGTAKDTLRPWGDGLLGFVSALAGDCSLAKLGFHPDFPCF